MEAMRKADSAPLDKCGQPWKAGDVFALLFALHPFVNRDRAQLVGVEGEWLEPESNRRHEDFQSSALPTELSSRPQGREECPTGS